jgi:DNA polymerase-1
VWLQQAGAPFDVDAWRALSDAAVTEQVEIEQELTALAGTADLVGGSMVKWSSPAQVAKLLRERGHDVTSVDESVLRRLADAGEALAPLVLRYRDASKRAGTYGIEWLRHVHRTTGRIHPDYRQLGAGSGRMSCDGPNLQNIPRDPAYRACFRPSPGRVLIKADYAQIELRLAAEIANDGRMVAAFQRGDDLHELTARRVLGKDHVTKSDRQAAKALNFGLLYGMGAQTLRQHAAQNYGVRLSQDEAEDARNRFFDTYPGLRAWHHRAGNGRPETRTILGRRRLGVERYTEKLNSPVQGSGADGLKAALALLWETREQAPGAVPVLCVHDEIVIETAAATAEGTRAWLVDGMTRGMQTVLRKVPVEVEATICADWSGTPAADPRDEVGE